MKIHFLILDYTLKGGVERFVANMANSLAEHGFGVTIHSFHKTNRQPLYETDSRVKIDYVTHIPFVSSLYKFSTFWACSKIIRSLKTKGSEHQFISTHPITTIYCRWICKTFSKRVITSEHSSYMSHNLLIRTLRSQAYRDVKKIVTQTEDGRKNFARDGLRAIKIYNSVTNFNDTFQWSSRSYNKSDSKKMCLTIARFEPVKQLDHFLEVAKIVSATRQDIEFVMIGDGYLLPALKQKISDNNLHDLVRIIPPTPHVNAHYAKASIYLITSESESFSMTMVEALSFGVPVISYSNLVGPAEIIKSGKNGYLVTQDNYAEMAELIIQILQQDDMMEKLSKGALESAFDFRDEQVLQKWKCIFDEH